MDGFDKGDVGVLDLMDGMVEREGGRAGAGFLAIATMPSRGGEEILEGE